MADNSLLSQSNAVFSKLYDVLKTSPKRVVFCDGEDIRVLQAARQLADEKLIVPILLGNKEKILSLAASKEIAMNFIRVIDPETSPDLEHFESRLERMEKFRGRVIANTREMISNPHNFGAMMVQYGHADGLVAGNKSQPVGIFRAVSNFIKPLDGVSLFGVAVMFAPHLKNMGSEGMLFLADCGMTPDPTVEQLANFGVETGKLAAHFLEKPPKVAFLSHSTQGSMVSPSSQKMAAANAMALDLANRNSLAMTIVGEVQADVALDPLAAEMKAMSGATHTSDVLIFPNLDAAHISFKLLKHVGGAQHYGQLIMGLTKPAAQVPKTTSVETLIGTATLVGVEAVKGRKHIYEW